MSQSPDTTPRPSGIDLQWVDATIRPQDDLFGHVNGRWLETVEIPADKGRWGAFDELREQSEADVRALIEEAAESGAAEGVSAQVAGLYRSFMNEDRIEALGATPLAADLAEVAALTEVAQVPGLLGRWARAGVDGLFAPFVNTDDRASDTYIVYLEQMGLGLPDESYYREEQHAEVRAAYLAHVTTMLELAGIGPADEAAARVIDLETRLAAAHWDRVSNRDSVKTYTKVERRELDDLTDGFDWTAYLAGLGADESALPAVIARQPSYLTAMGAALREVDIATWQDWLRWRLVHARAPYLSSAFVDENFDFYGRTLSGIPQLRERWKRGVAFVEGAVGEAVGQLYVQRHFPPQAKERMDELVANVVEAFRRSFADLPWMGEATRAEALAKLDSFTPKVGHPETWKDYSALVVDAGDLVGNVVRSSAVETDRELRKLGGEVDRGEWFMTPQTVNAYYNPGMNEIVFPAAILRPPFFDANADDAANYGGIAAVIGHEIGHGFDDQGSTFDGTGELRNWWTDEDRAGFEQRTKALIGQFDAKESRFAPGKTVNGALTVGENIGDLGGLAIGFKAYQIANETTGEPPVIEGLTGEQRFFYGWAQVWRGKSRLEEAERLLAIDPHSPADLRGNAVDNVDAFHEAFGTAEGDGLWLDPTERVSVF